MTRDARSAMFLDASLAGGSMMTTSLKYEYALSITTQFYFCGIPFRLDLSPKCSLNCLYCFAMARGGRRTDRRLLADPASIERKLERVFDRGVLGDAVGEMLTHRVPLHFGGLSDPFANHSTTTMARKVLESLARYRYPVVLSTKNPEALLRRDMFEVLTSNPNVVIQISLTTTDSEFARKVEPNVPPPRERLRYMRELSRAGLHCVCRLQPLFFTHLTEVTRRLPPMVAKAGCRHVVVEFLKLPVERTISQIGRLMKAIEWDAYDFYKQHGAHVAGREWVLPAEFKWESLQELVSAIHACGMTYGSGDYGLNHLGDTACCCGIDHLPGFSRWFRGNLANVVRSSPSDRLRASLMDEYWYPQKSVRRIMNSRSRLSGPGQAIRDYLARKWNCAGSANALSSFLGVAWSGEYDEDGNRVYVRCGVKRLNGGEQEWQRR